MLRVEIEQAVKKHGAERLGVLTVTVPDDLQWSDEAGWAEFMRRWHSFAFHVIEPRVLAWCRVVEPQKSGRIHLHAVLVLEKDIRTGVNFEAFASRDYRSASPYLRRWWAILRAKAPRYGFGRCELLPVKSPEGFGFYVGKYLGKGSDEDGQGFRGRRVAYSGTWSRSTSMRAAWVNGNGERFRAILRQLGRDTGRDSDDLWLRLGPSWAFKVWRKVGDWEYALHELRGGDVCATVEELAAGVAVSLGIRPRQAREVPPHPLAETGAVKLCLGAFGGSINDSPAECLPRELLQAAGRSFNL